MHGRVTCLGATILGSAMLFACGGSNEQSTNAAYPMYSQQGGNAGYAQPGQPGQPGQQPQPGGYVQPQTQPGGYTQPQPLTQPQVQPQVQPAAGVQEVDASMAAPVQPMLQQLGKTQAPAGARPLGNLLVANFPAPGGSLSKQIQFTANKCYTIVAAGAPGVTEVNIKIPSLVPFMAPVAEDKSTGSQAVLGANPHCYMQPLVSAAVNVVIEVPQGQGLVAVQVYEK